MTAKWILILVLYVSQHILACDDVSTSACQKFAAQNPGMCHDGSCYATLCPRTCHKCASLKCFSCGAVARPEMCSTTIECPSKDFECIIAKSFTHDFREEFALGCALRSVCDSHNNGMSCCSTDLCNNKQQTTARKQLPIRRENKGKAVRQTVASCSDIHEDGCRDLLSTDPNICDTTCAKTLCPVTCGGCKQCYDCEFVSDSSHCTSTRVCQPGEYCYRIEAVSANFEHGFRLGCATDILCSKLTSMAFNVFGRKRSVAGDCCHGNLCNDHIKTVTTTTVMATTQPTTKRTTTRTTSKHSSCPCAGTDHFQVNNECFFVSSSHGTRQQGRDYCISHCGQLAAFTDESQLETVRLRIYSSSHFHNHHFDHMFVDAVKYHKSYTHPTYIWESTGRPVPTIFLRHRNNTATYNDMCAVTSGVHSTHIQSESCSANRYALCQLRKH